MDNTNLDTTGYTDDDQVREISYPFDQFVVTVLVDGNGRFLAVKEIAINKDFMDYRQRGSLRGLPNVEDFYREEEG